MSLQNWISTQHIFWLLGCLLHCKLTCLHRPYLHRSLAKYQFNLPLHPQCLMWLVPTHFLTSSRVLSSRKAFLSVALALYSLRLDTQLGLYLLFHESQLAISLSHQVSFLWQTALLVFPIYPWVCQSTFQSVVPVIYNFGTKINHVAGPLPWLKE